MRTVEKVLEELRALAAKAAAGENVSVKRGELEVELAKHGIRVQPTQPAPHGSSRFVGPGADRDAAAALAAGQPPLDGRPTPPNGECGGLTGVELLLAVRGAKAGDPESHRKLASVSRAYRSADEKALVGGAYLVEQDRVPGYIEALAAANPLRDLATGHDVTGREVKMLIEGDEVLVTEHVPEGATKPSSNASVVQTVNTIHKAAGVTDLPDELIDDSDGEAANLISANFARSIGHTVDVALANGTGVGQPLGILKHPSVDHVAVSGQQAMAVYQSIVRRVTVLAGRLQTDLTVVLHPSVLERFDLALNSNGDFLFPDGLTGKLTGKARVVQDANLPVGTGNTVPIIVGAFKRGLHFFSRKALVIESSQTPGFISDETTFRAVERYGAFVAKPSSFEVIDGLDLDHIEGA